MNYDKGDVKLFSTIDGGEINVENGLTEMTGGFETAIYLSLFGGNKKYDGTEATKKYEYWGNKLESDNPDRQLISRTQNILTGLPATPNNLNLVNQAIKLDLNWMITENIIDDLTINLSIPKKNRIDINIEGKKDKETIFDTKYEQNWIAESQNK